MKPYTYLLGWSSNNKFYYGVRYAKACDPADLWETYFTSSKHVKAFVACHGDPDIIQIRKVFDTRDQAIAWEHKVLRRLKVTQNNKWLNMTDNKAVNFERTPEIMALISQKISAKNKGRAPTFQGRKHTQEAKEKNRLAHLGKKTGRTSEHFTEEWKTRISQANKGRIRKQSLSEKEGRSFKVRETGFNKINAGRIWINNGLESIRVYPEQLESYPGYTRGRLKAHTSLTLQPSS